MSNQVYANNMEISCKSAAGKSICAFPDVCFTPPLTPATPPGVPIPYPNTGMASDCTSGSTTVKISGNEVMLKNKSYFKKSTGDEAGSAPKKGVVTSKNMGKVYFNAWSMDVMVEGENAVRMLDITTHNHGSLPGNSPPWPYIDEANVPAIYKDKCGPEKDKEKKACDGCDTADKACNSPACQEARKCMLLPYGGSGSPNCCKGQTAHHIVEKHIFKKKGKVLNQFTGYNENSAPCVCAAGSRYSLHHGGFHALQGKRELAAMARAAKKGSDTEFAWNYGQARKAGVDAHKKVFPGSKCDSDCIKAQIDSYHKSAINDLKDTTPVRSSTPPLKPWQKGLISKIIAAMKKQLGGQL
jgi:Domain of unknown function (DUF4150)/GHH signature containing HNH/Endo VII superfamily nuclease toxin  2